MCFFPPAVYRIVHGVRAISQREAHSSAPRPCNWSACDRTCVLPSCKSKETKSPVHHQQESQLIFCLVALAANSYKERQNFCAHAKSRQAQGERKAEDESDFILTFRWSSAKPLCSLYSEELASRGKNECGCTMHGRAHANLCRAQQVALLWTTFATSGDGGGHSE